MRAERLTSEKSSLNRSLWLYAIGKAGFTASGKISGKALCCPKCGIAMRVVSLPNLSLEICPQCRGIFLDDGELEKLTGARG